MLLERLVARLLDDAQLVVHAVEPLGDRFALRLEAARLVEQPDDERRPLVERKQNLVRDAVDRAHRAAGADAARAFDDHVFGNVRPFENGAVELLDLDLADGGGRVRAHRRSRDCAASTGAVGRAASSPLSPSVPTCSWTSGEKWNSWATSSSSRSLERQRRERERRRESARTG